MTVPAEKSGQFPLGDLTVNRIGYGAMQLAGPHVMGPPADREASAPVPRRAVELGVDHIDTSDYYGPHVTNEIIREALHPYPENLVIVTKVGAKRGSDKSWRPAHAGRPARRCGGQLAQPGSGCAARGESADWCARGTESRVF